MERRPATPEEVRALAHPLRMRIIRLCIDEARTNKQLAERLGKDPGSVLFHVRKLVDTGFLTSGDPVKGATGAWEKPYRSTGKSWELSVEDLSTSGALLMIDAVRAEVLESGPRSVRESSRLGLRLKPEDAEELAERLVALADEFHGRRDAEGEPFGLFLLLHELAD